MSERYDIAIIGSGPAGISAAINAKIRKKNFILFGDKNSSAKLRKAHAINNYPGLYGISGNELKNRFLEHLQAMDIEITEERVNNIYPMGEYYTLLANDKMYEATTIILAVGVNFGKPLTGEEEFLGKGVSYCATCDANFYRGKTVTIIAYNKHEEAEVNYVAGIAAKVYLVPMYTEPVEVDESVEIVQGTPVEIVGDQTVKKLILKETELETDGVFILRDSVSPGQLVPGLVMDGSHVQVDRMMQANLPGCFAAGDIVGTPYQYIKAAGEGNIATLSAVAYLDELKKK
ncbi:MAG: NAD(P)/FAD-dependent oxidoreductase [Clostridiales bacterium]|nr:NAD(P)/FAD-dependent oxidoreductase [Clostridiales bacterium]